MSLQVNMFLNQKKKMTDLWSNLSKETRPIVLYGMGDGADKMLSALEKIGKTPAGVFASDDFVRGQSFRGYPVLTYAQAREQFDDMIVLVSFGTQLDDVMQNIRSIAKNQTLFAPDLAVCGDGLFTADYYQNNLQDYNFIYNNLADDLSRKTFECIVNYKLTGDIDYLIQCESTPSEAYNNILRLGKNETFVDLGAYRGDTVKEFLDNTDGHGKIIAVEPDIKNFNKLSLAFGNRAECINAAASDKDGLVPFDTRRGRSSHISGSGKMIKSVTVDSLVADCGATYIKLDVEGNEKCALNGAKNTIILQKPKLCVAAYHRAFDIFEIPKQVLSMRGDYKMYLRHFPYIPAWDTNYYFV